MCGYRQPSSLHTRTVGRADGRREPAICRRQIIARRSIRTEEPIMAIYYFIETEVAHRRSELERELATAGQVAQTRPEHGSKRWSRLPRLAFAHLRSLSTPL